MDVKDLQSEDNLGDRNNDGSKYPSSAVTLPYSRNKSYQDVNSVSLGKVDAPTGRPCAVIGPDRVLPPPISSDTIKKSAFETWYADNVYRHHSDYSNKMTNYNTPIRNISPRQTYQENMQRIMVPPTYNSLKGNEEYNSSMDKNISLTKSTKPNIPIETKYCEVPYSGNPTINEQKSVRNAELSASNVNPVLARCAPQGWPSHARQPRPYGVPELFHYPDYTNCAGPRPVPMSRPHRTAHEDLSHGYPDSYCHDVRFKPYTTVKDRYQQARYEFISNYPSPFHPPSVYPPHKYDMQKPISQPYTYQQVPLKYLDNQTPDPVVDGYQRPTQQSNYNLPFHNQMIHPAYGPIVGNCIQNKFPCQPDGSVKSVAPNKQPYEPNKIYTEYENVRSKAFPVSENYYFNEMQRPPHHIKSQVMPNYAINMHRFPPHPYYTKDNSPLKNYEYMPHFRNIDPSVLSQSRIPSQFSPNGITISPSDTNLSLDNPQIQGMSQEDYGYVNQSPNASIRNTDFAVNRSINEFYRRYDSRYGQTIRPPPIMAKHEQVPSENSKDKKDIDVRQFLQMWNEVDDENTENATKETVAQFPSDVNKTTKQYETVKNQDQLYVLGLVNVPSEELGKYEHIQKVSKLPENIKGYNSIELLNQFEEVIESSKVNNFKSKSSTAKDVTYHISMKNSGSHLSLLPRPVSPLDVEAKISQSVIHKEVGCNFEIKPCSPKMLNVEAATPIQNLLGERVIEKVSNQLIITSPLMNAEDKLNCKVLTHQEQRKPVNENLKNSSCKMINTQFKSNDTVRPNYSLQDLESNSGVCLASLPRLDNDIELNFPEVNQQFINANKAGSVITAIKDLPSLSLEHIENVNSTEDDSNICLKPDSNSELPSVIETEREFSKLSKYRKIKKCGHESVEKDLSFSSTQNMRTDSVIIKNPDNPKIFEQNKDTLTIETSFNDLTNKENLIDNLETNKDLSNNAMLINSHTDTAIDFSLNKNDDNNTVSSPIDYYVQNQSINAPISNSTIENITKHSDMSQNTDLLKDNNIGKELKIKTLISEADTVMNDKRENELFTKNCDADKKENQNSQTENKSQLNESCICLNTDDMRPLEKITSYINKDNENESCEIKSKEFVTVTNYEENKSKTENHNLISVALSAEDSKNDKNREGIHIINNIYTTPENIESNLHKQCGEKSNLDLPVVNAENAIPLISDIKQYAQERQKGNKNEGFQQESGEENINVAFIEQTDLSDLNEENAIPTTLNSKQNLQKGEMDSKNEFFLEDNDECYTDATFKDETDLRKERLETNLCSNDEQSYKNTENETQKGEKGVKIELFFDGHDRDNTDIILKNQNNIIQEKLDTNLCCSNEDIDKSTGNELQEVLDNKQIYERNETFNDSNENNGMSSKTNVTVEDMTQSSLTNRDTKCKNSNKLESENDQESDVLCRDICFSEPPPMITAPFLGNSQRIISAPSNSTEKSNTLESALITDEDSNQLPLSFRTLQKTDVEESNHKLNNLDKTGDNPDNDFPNANILPNDAFKQNVIIETNTGSLENNEIRETKIRAECNEKPICLDSTSNEIQCEKSTCENIIPCTGSFRSCQLKKELFSPFIQKLVSLNEGPIKPQTMENSFNVQANTTNHYYKSKYVENIEIEDKKLDDHCTNSGSSNENITSNENTTCNTESVQNVEIASCDLICESTDKDTHNESITANDNAVALEKEAQDVMESSGTIKLGIYFSGSDTDLCTQISSKDCITNSSDKDTNESINVEETLENISNVAESLERREMSATIALLLPSHGKKIFDDITFMSENDILNNDNDYHAIVSDPKDDNDILTPINEEMITNNELNTECALNELTLQDRSDKYILQNKSYQDFSRPCLKRSLSDSALDLFNNSSDAVSSKWRPKRPKNKICNVLESDIIFDSNSQNNRRKSISSIYNEQNVSFCILIDNNCIITEEENADKDEICFTEVSEACLTNLQESVNHYNGIITPNPLETSEECKNDNEYSETQEVEESWVDDVGCIETVVSDDVAEDITISASSSPERMHSPDNDESGMFMNSDHTDKVKHIYGDKMCNDDVMFLETLYRTPQMNVNKIINRESQVSEECIQYYNRDSLEKVLSESSSHEDLRCDLETSQGSDTNYRNPLDGKLTDDMQREENVNKEYILPTEKSSPVYDTYNKNESNDFQNNDRLLTTLGKTQDDTVHSCESSIDNVFSYSQKDEYRTFTSSTSPEVSSTTSEERNSSILLKITNFKGSRVSQVNDFGQETKSMSCKFTELNDYSSSQNFKTNRPLITKAAQKYIPPLEETLGDLKIRLPLPQHSLLRLKQLKLLKEEPKSNKCNTKSKPDIPKKPRPKFEDVLKSIDEIQFKMHKEKSRKNKKSIPKVVIKKNENGSHYASTTNIKPFNPDLTGRKWQPWVFLEKNHFIDKMAVKNKRKAIFNHRKNTYVLADKFRKYKSIGNAKFVISQPNMHSSSIGHLKCTIRLKHTY